MPRRTRAKVKKLSAKQQRLLDAVPWVRVLAAPKSCDGWMRTGKGCKNPAWYRFTGLPKRQRGKWSMYAKTGNYCWSHLMSRGLWYSMDEEARTDAQLYAVGYYCQSVSPSGRRCTRAGWVDHDEHHTRGYVEPYGPEPDVVKYTEVWRDEPTRLKAV